MNVGEHLSKNSKINKTLVSQYVTHFSISVFGVFLTMFSKYKNKFIFEIQIYRKMQGVKEV